MIKNVTYKELIHNIFQSRIILFLTINNELTIAKNIQIIVWLLIHRNKKINSKIIKVKIKKDQLYLLIEPM